MPASAKQTGQCRSQRCVTSSSTEQVCWRCSAHKPQSYGQPFFTSVVGFLGNDGVLGLTQLRKLASPRQMTVRNSPCCGQVFSRYTSPPRTTRAAGIRARHSGHTLSVCERILFILPIQRGHTHFQPIILLPFAKHHSPKLDNEWIGFDCCQQGFLRNEFRQIVLCIPF